MRGAPGLLALFIAASSAGQAEPAAPPSSQGPRSPEQEPGEKPPELSPETGAALLRLLPDRYARDENGRVIDVRTGNPVTQEQAEAALAALGGRVSPGGAGSRAARTEAGFEERRTIERGRLDAAGRRAMRAASASFGSAPRSPGAAPSVAAPGAGGAAERLAKEAAALPRAQLPGSLRRPAAPPPPLQPASQAPAVSRELNDLLHAFNVKLAGIDKDPKKVSKDEVKGKGLGRGWLGNGLYGYKCQRVHDTFKQLIEKKGLGEKYPGMEFVSLYQPGVAPGVPFMGGVGNHVFIGLREKETGRLTHYFDPWANMDVAPYRGRDRLPLRRDSLTAIPWNGSASYRVDDRGLPARQ